MQVAIPPIANDRELVARLGLNEELLCRFLGRRRAPLAEALDGPRPYLQPLEIAQLRAYTQCLGKTDCDDAAILEYLDRRHEQRSVDYVRESLKHIAAPVDLSSHEEIWVIMPDFVGLLGRGRATFVKKLPELGCHLAFFLGSPIARERLYDFLGAPNLTERKLTARVITSSYICSQETRVFGDPRSKTVKTYVVGKNGLVGETASERRMQDYARIIWDRTSDDR